MKKDNIIAVLSMVFLLAGVVSMFVIEIHPVQKIAGVIREVERKTPRTKWVRGHTVINFKDGRTAVFDGVYAGMVFEKDRECEILYRQFNGNGFYIKKIEYR